MSDSTIPFQGQTAVLDRPADVTRLEPLTEGGGRTRLLALGGVAALVLLGILAYFLLIAGGKDTAVNSPAVKPRPAVPAAPAAEEPVTVKQPKISRSSFGRDPFKALISDPAAAGSVSGATVTSTGTTVDTSTGPTTGTTTTTGTVTPVVTADHIFRVVGVSSNGKTITVRVDGKNYSGLRAGEVFATYFKVVVIGGKVNGFQFGDERFSVFGTKKLHIAA